MIAVLKGIIDKFDGNAALKAAVTGLYLNDAPQEITFPYIVYFLISTTPQDTFNTYSEDITIQFSIFSNTRSTEEVNNIFELLKTCYDYATLAVTGYSHIEMRRQESNLLREPDDAAWHYQCDYRVLIQKN